MAQVFDLKRGVYIQYALSPVEAVIAADQQYTHLNWNTWTYPYGHSKMDIRTVKLRSHEVTLVSLGNHCCMCEVGCESKYQPQDYEPREEAA